LHEDLAWEKYGFSPKKVPATAGIVKLSTKKLGAEQTPGKNVPALNAPHAIE